MVFGQVVTCRNVSLGLVFAATELSVALRASLACRRHFWLALVLRRLFVGREKGCDRVGSLPRYTRDNVDLLVRFCLPS